MYNNFFRLKSSTLWKHFSDSPISVRNFILFWLVFTFLTHQSENGFNGNAHVIVLIQQQFQCSSFRVNERALQTEGPSQRTNDDDPGTFLLINACATSPPSVVLAECDWRCVTSLFPSFITFKHFQKPRWTFLQSAYSVNRLNSQLLIMQVKIFFSNFCFSTFDTKWFWKLPYFLLNKKFLRLKSEKNKFDHKLDTKVKWCNKYGNFRILTWVFSAF